MIPTWYAAGCAGARRYSARITRINAEDPPNSDRGVNEELHFSCVWCVCYVCMCVHATACMMSLAVNNTGTQLFSLFRSHFLHLTPSVISKIYRWLIVNSGGYTCRRVYVSILIAERITMLFYLSSRNEEYREHHVPLVFFPETREKAKQIAQSRAYKIEESSVLYHSL